MKKNWNKTLITLGISTLAFAAAQNAKSQPMMSDNDSTMPVSAQHFVREAAMTDMTEIHAGELALQKSDNADVKKFAKKLVSDHKKACKKLQAIAEKENLDFPDTNSMSMGGWQTNHWNSNSNWNDNAKEHALATMSTSSPDHIMKAGERTEYNNMTTNNEEEMEMGGHPVMLETLSGEEFDRAFAAKMVKGHEKAIRKFEMAANNLTDADLKKYAEKTLPTLREHLQMAQELQGKVGTWTDAGMTNSMPAPDQNR